MPIINDIIDSRSWIPLRNQIGALIKTELFHQSAMTYNDWLDCNVFIERWLPVTIDECRDSSVINVTIESITPTNRNRVDSRTAVVFNIFVHTSMMANTLSGIDVNSAIRNQDVTSVIEGIFSHPACYMLGYNHGFIERQEITDIKFGAPDRLESAGMSISMITLSVICSQVEPLESGMLLTEALTSVKLNNTDQGYKFEMK